MKKSEALALVRIELHEATANLWTDNDLYALMDAELRTLPKKSVYKEEVWKGTTELKRDEYPLPTGTRHIEKLEFNEGSDTDPCWVEDIDYDVYGNVLYLSFLPTNEKKFRVRLKKSFTAVSTLGSNDNLDVPDSVIEVLIKGTALRAFGNIMAYFIDASNWDYVAKPDGISMNQVQNWFKQVKDDYNEALALARTVPKPKCINLLG